MGGDIDSFGIGGACQVFLYGLAIVTVYIHGVDFYGVSSIRVGNPVFCGEGDILCRHGLGNFLIPASEGVAVFGGSSGGRNFCSKTNRAGVIRTTVHNPGYIVVHRFGGYDQFILIYRSFAGFEGKLVYAINCVKINIIELNGYKAILAFGNGYFSGISAACHLGKLVNRLASFVINGYSRISGFYGQIGIILGVSNRDYCFRGGSQIFCGFGKFKLVGILHRFTVFGTRCVQFSRSIRNVAPVDRLILFVVCIQRISLYASHFLKDSIPSNLGSILYFQRNFFFNADLGLGTGFNNRQLYGFTHNFRILVGIFGSKYNAHVAVCRYIQIVREKALKAVSILPVESAIQLYF